MGEACTDAICRLSIKRIRVLILRQRIAFKLPFVDRLNDNYTSFKYTPPQLISLNLAAYAGSLFYGKTQLGNFEPECNPYQTDSRGNSVQSVYVFPGSSSLGSKTAFNTTFRPTSGNPYSIDM